MTLPRSFTLPPNSAVTPVKVDPEELKTTSSLSSDCRSDPLHDQLDGKGVEEDARKGNGSSLSLIDSYDDHDFEIPTSSLKHFV